MVVGAEQTAKRLLKDIVPDELLIAYTQLLAHGGCVQGDAADLLGGAELVEALIDAGMAHVQSSGPALPPRLRPTRRGCSSATPSASFAESATARKRDRRDKDSLTRDRASLPPH